jgi:hypothetical protein
MRPVSRLATCEGGRGARRRLDSGVGGEELEVLEVETGRNDAADERVCVGRNGSLPHPGPDDDLRLLAGPNVDAERLDAARERCRAIAAELERDDAFVGEPDLLGCDAVPRRALAGRQVKQDHRRGGPITTVAGEHSFGCLPGPAVPAPFGVRLQVELFSQRRSHPRILPHGATPDRR